MTDKLPPPLLALFQPRPPLRYIPPADRAPEDCKKSTISGVAQFLPEAKAFQEEAPYNATESWLQRKWRQKLERKDQMASLLTQGLQNCTHPLLKDIHWSCSANHILDVIDHPENDPHARGDPFRTLFVARLSYDVKDADLEREFGRFGPIERVRCRPSHPHSACWLLTLC